MRAQFEHQDMNNTESGARRMQRPFQHSVPTSLATVLSTTPGMDAGRRNFYHLLQILSRGLCNLTEPLCLSAIHTGTRAIPCRRS